MLEDDLPARQKTDPKFKEPAANDYALLVQRIFSFAEPEQKFEWITELLSKLCLDSLSRRCLKNKPGWLVPQTFSRTGFGLQDGQDINPVNYLVTAAWALSYTCIFTETSFEHWQSRFFEKNDLLAPPYIVQKLNRLKPFIVDLNFDSANDSIAAKERWLYLWLACDIDWLKLLNKLESPPFWLEELIKQSGSISPVNRQKMSSYIQQVIVQCVVNKQLPNYVISPRLLVLVEGPTEALLLPEMARQMGFNFNESGIHLVVAGGSKPVAGKYLDYATSIKLPIVAVLDADAADYAEIIRQSLRNGDYLFVFKGEIEDVFEEAWFLDLIYEFLQLQCEQSVSSQEAVAESLAANPRRVESLNILWRKHGLGDFDKIGFAKFLVHKLQAGESLLIPEEMSHLINILRATISNEVKA